MKNWSILNRQKVDNASIDLLDVIEGRIDGIIINDVLSSEDLELVNHNIQHNFTTNNSHHHHKELENDSHLGAHNSFDNYIEQSKHHEELQKRLGIEFNNLFQRLFEKLTALNVKRPSYKNVNYKSSVVKLWNEGEKLLPHYDSVLGETDEGKHLTSLGDIKKIISFVLMLQVPEQGGELVIYNLSYDNTLNTFKPLNKIKQQLIEVYLDKKKVLKYKIPPQNNSLVIFPGGQYWHKVKPIIGKKTRITTGGLMMPSFNNQDIYFWDKNRTN